MFEEYGYWRKQGKRGFIEFKFYFWEQLSNAIKTTEKLAPYDHVHFVAMPGTPSYNPPGVKQFPLPLRKITPTDCADFNEVRFTATPVCPFLRR